MEDMKGLADETAEFADTASAGLLEQPDFVSELQNLDLSLLIGGPLNAAILGLESACRNTLNFMKRVCFEEDLTPKMLEFELNRPGGMLNLSKTSQKIQIPFLTMVPIPHLRLAKVRVEFSVKLNSVRSTDLSSISSGTGITTSSSENEVEVEDDDNFSLRKSDDEKKKTEEKTTGVKKNTSTSLIGVTTVKRETAAGAKIEKDYSLSIVVTAVQDELPRGIEKMLDILENEVQSGPEDTGLQGQLLQGAMGNVGFGGGGGAAAGGAGGAGGAGAAGGADGGV